MSPTALPRRIIATTASHIVAAACGAAAAAAAAAICLSDKRQLKMWHEDKEDVPSGRSHRHTRRHDAKNSKASATLAASPTLPITVFRPHADMEIAFDSRTRNPCYVLERLPSQHERVALASAGSSPQSSKEEKASRRSMHFHEEKLLPTHHRSRNSYYKHSGFDRGHLIPSSDFAGDQSAMMKTFNLCNISPQNSTFNRRIWGRLEALVRNVAREEFEESGHNGDNDAGGKGRSTYIVTGPLWLPTSVENKPEMLKKSMYRYSHLAIGQPPSLVQVPTHFFKVVAVVNDDCSTNSIVKIAAFVLPNEDVTTARGSSVDLQRYLVRISDLEAVSGMTFFPDYLGLAEDPAEKKDTPDDIDLRSLADALTEELWDSDRSSSFQKRIDIDDNKEVVIVPFMRASANPSAASIRRRKRMIQVAKASNLPMQHLCDSGRCSVVVKATK